MVVQMAFHTQWKSNHTAELKPSVCVCVCVVQYSVLHKPLFHTGVEHCFIGVPPDVCYSSHGTQDQVSASSQRLQTKHIS